jgi:tetratricopeptide (TPR) repeat protein
MRLVTLGKRLLSIAVLVPVAALGDQTDPRLDELFAILKASEDAVVRQTTIRTIWDIWFESDREDIGGLMAQGGEALRVGRLETAEQMFTRVIEIAPEFSEGWNRRATVRYHRGDCAGSLDDIERTLALEPRHFGAIWGQGMIFARQRKLTGAIRAFERLLEINPYSSDAMRRIGLLKEELERNSL